MAGTRLIPALASAVTATVIRPMVIRALDRLEGIRVSGASAGVGGHTQMLQQQADLLDLARDGIFVRDLHTRAIRYWNQGAEQLYGYTADQAVGAAPSGLLRTVYPQPLEEIEAAVVRDGYWEGELVHTARDGSRLVVASRWALQRDSRGHPSAILELNTDIGERKRYEDQLRHQAIHDTLTGLPNRMLLTDRLEQAVRRCQRDGTPAALLLMDLNHFKVINDTLGHATGDALLVQVADRFRAVVRDMDTVARLGGDEFAIVLPSSDREGALGVVRRIQEALADPVVVDERILYVETSIGLAMAPHHGVQGTELLRRADVAMYAAKRAGIGFEIYRAEDDPHSEERLTLATDLRRAIDRNELVLHYQPKVSLGSGRVQSVEALLRWRHPEGRVVSPIEFIPLAEQTGLIKPLTLWVLDTALEQARAWYDAGLDLPVAVNLSVSSRLDADLVDTVVDLLARRGLPPDRLQLEITESALMADPASALAAVSRLHEHGVRIAIDDFGVEHSSLSYLQRLPIDEIKIDRSFVLDMARGVVASQVIVQSVIDLGHNLGFAVVAEGAETQEMLDVLTVMRCDSVQGYAYSRPAPADRLTGWLQEHERAMAEHLLGADAPSRQQVVIVEDDPGILEVLQEALEFDGFDVVTLNHPSRVAELTHRPALMMIDAMLPGMSGIELGARLRRQFPEVPLLAMSASPLMITMAQESGLFQSVLQKPFDIAAVLDLVHTAIRARPPTTIEPRAS